jgi:hypothetical protein
MREMIGIFSLWNTSRTALRLFAVTLTFCALAWASDEPWKSKPYQQWIEKDIEHIFAYSPWSQKAELTRTWLPLKAEELPQLISGDVRTLPKGLEQSDEGKLGAEVNFNVYWASSRVMRAASARKAGLHGEKKGVDVEKYANEPQDEYQIVIQGADMAPFVRKDEKFSQANAFLQTKKTKQKISPSHVRYERDAEGVLVTAAVFFFPKKTPSGDRTITLDEKSVEFTCKIEGSTLRVNFAPQKMIDQIGPTL